MKINIFADGEDDPINEAYYFAELWPLVGRQVMKTRNKLDTHLK